MSLYDLAKGKNVSDLVDAAEYVWRGCQGPTYKEFLAMDLLEQSAFVKASDRLKASAAMWHGVASMGPVGTALAGGDMGAAEEMWQEQAHASARADAEREVPNASK